MLSLMTSDGNLLLQNGDIATSTDDNDDCGCCGGGDCCRVGKVCFGSPGASTLSLTGAVINSVDLSTFGYSATSKVFLGFWEGQTADYVTDDWGEEGPPGGWTTLGCAEVRSGWIRLGATPDPHFMLINVWVRVTAWYSSDNVWHVKLEFAGASDGSGTLVTVEDSKALDLFDDFPTLPSAGTTKSPAAWDNGSAGTWSVVNASPCCRDGNTCQESESTPEPDSVGDECCEPKYAEPYVICGPFPELMSGYYVRISDVTPEKIFMVGGKRHLLGAGATFCDPPAGRTLLEPMDPQPDYGCLPFNKCTGEDGMTPVLSTLVVPANLTLNEYGSIFTGATGPGCVYSGVTPTDTGDSVPYAVDQWRWDTLGSNEFFGCSDPLYGCYQMPDLTGWTSIDLMVTLVSECPYYELIGYDEETEEPIYDLIPEKQYYEALFRIGCDIVFSVLFRSGDFDPDDPQTPVGIGDFTYVSTDGSPPGGMTVATTISFSGDW